MCGLISLHKHLLQSVSTSLELERKEGERLTDAPNLWNVTIRYNPIIQPSNIVPILLVSLLGNLDLVRRERIRAESRGLRLKRARGRGGLRMGRERMRLALGFERILRRSSRIDEGRQFRV